jgi:hypothetical protein
MGEAAKNVVNQVFCNRCKNRTNHRLVGGVTRESVDEDSGWPVEKWVDRLWVCLGCNTGTLQRGWWCEGEEDEYGGPAYTFTYFPSRDPLVKKTFQKLPARLSAIYSEVVGAFNNDLPILCAIGLRALIEGICSDKKVAGKDLSHKINGLKGLLPENLVKNLHNFRYLGNEAAHELESPISTELLTAISVSEDLLGFLYDLDYKAESLATLRKMRANNPTPEDPNLIELK